MIVLVIGISIISLFNKNLGKTAKFRDKLITHKYESSLNENLGFLTLFTTEVSNEFDLKSDSEKDRTAKIKEYLLCRKIEIENIKPEQGAVDFNTDDFKLETAEMNSVLKILAPENSASLDNLNIGNLNMVKHDYKEIEKRAYLHSSNQTKGLQSFVFIPTQLVASQDDNFLVSNTVKREILFSKCIEEKLLAILYDKEWQKIFDDGEAKNIYQAYFIPISGFVRILNKEGQNPFEYYKNMFQGLSSFSNRPYFTQTMLAADEFRVSNLYLDTSGSGIIVTYSIFVNNKNLNVAGMIGIDRRIVELKGVLKRMSLGFGIGPRDFEVGFHPIPSKENEQCGDCHSGRFGTKFDFKKLEKNFDDDKKIVAQALADKWYKPDEESETISRKEDADIGSTVYLIRIGPKEVAYFLFNPKRILRKYQFLTFLYYLSLLTIIALIGVTLKFVSSKAKAEKSHLEVLRHLNGGLIVVDQEGEIKLHNPKMAELVEDSNLYGKNFLSLYLSNESKTEYEHLSGRSKKGFEFTGRIERKDKTVFPAIITSASINYPGLPNAQMLIIIPSEQLERTIAAKFIHGFSHTLKTPITSILLLADRLRRKKAQPKFDYYFSLMQQQVDEFTNMLTNLLGFSKLEVEDIRVRKENTNLAAMLRSAIKSFQEKASRNKIELVANVPDRLMANIDKGMFYVIINNLLENALKYTNEGKIIVDTHETPGKITISCKDTGIGVPTDEKGKIFEKFYRGNTLEVQKKDGIGIGLYLSRKYVELNGGTLTYETRTETKKNKIGMTTEKEIGSTFIIQIPKE